MKKEEAAPPPPDPKDTAWLRNDTEWLTLRLQGGLWGFGGGAGLFTLRWRHFYWQIVRFDFTLGSPINYYGGGSAIGVPIYLTNDDRHELRIALGTMAMFYQRDATHWASLHLALAPELVYAYHIKKHATLHVGLTVYIPLPLGGKLGSSAPDPLFAAVVAAGMGF